MNNTLTNIECPHEVSWLRLVQGFGERHQRTCFVFLRQKSAEAYMMDPRDTPEYRLHRALSSLNSIDIEHLDSPDRERIVEATTLLEQVGLLTRPGASKKADTKVES